MLKSESFLDLPWSLLLTLVKEGELQVDEAQLFEAVQAWVSRNETERRHHVGEVGYLTILLGRPLTDTMEGMVKVCVSCNVAVVRCCRRDT